MIDAGDFYPAYPACKIPYPDRDRSLEEYIQDIDRAHGSGLTRVFGQARLFLEQS